jgi:hypothetical protein
VSDNGGVSPVHVACDRGHAGIVQLLCDGGAHVNGRTRDGLCPLHLACRCAHAIHISGHVSGQTRAVVAIAWRVFDSVAFRSGSLDCIAALISHSCDMEARAAGGLSALHIAVQDNMWGGAGGGGGGGGAAFCSLAIA